VTQSICASDFIFRAHPLLLLGLGMILMLVLWTLLTLAVNWWNITWDDIHYGRPRTFQVDAIVGHNDSSSNPSHFIADMWDYFQCHISAIMYGYPLDSCW
jgi:hypothetical protein